MARDVKRVGIYTEADAKRGKGLVPFSSSPEQLEDTRI